MRGPQSSFKSYGAIGHWVGDDVNQIGQILICDTKCKIAVPNRSIRELGSGGSGDANVYNPMDWI